MELKGKDSDSKSQIYSVGASQAPFGAMRYINGPQYPEGDREETESD